MQVPTRRSDKNKQPDTGPVYLTSAGVAVLKKQLESLERNLPQAIKEVERTKEYGDFSENHEYKEAKAKMRGMYARVATIKDKLKRVELIDTDKNSGVIQLGSTVEVEVAGEHKTYQLLGPEETDPASGRISHISPLGATLIGHQVGDEVVFEVNNTSRKYKIIGIK